jgi:GT2 family glycosyltransferase
MVGEARRNRLARHHLDVSVTLHYWLARLAGWLRPRRPSRAESPVRPAEPGISVVIPSRNGRELLAAQMPGILREMELFASEVIVVDNGSDDGTGDWLRTAYPQARVEVSAGPLSFARAVNRGIARARFSHVCLLNNDMLAGPGFFRALRQKFDEVTSLFCATAQIQFPPGARREETGKAVMAQAGPEDFPVRCDEPLPGEDGTYVLYGSGGCSLYDVAKLRALGCVDEAYEPAYVEDLDLGYRAWQRGWPTVFVAGAVVEHRHRTTTRRYYTEEQLEAVLEVNYLKFVARAVARRPVFERLWKQALDRLRLRAARPAAQAALRKAAGIARSGGPALPPDYSEDLFLAMTGGGVALFPGRALEARACIVRVKQIAAPPADLLAAYREVVVVREGEALALQAAREWTNRKWNGRVEERVEER